LPKSSWELKRFEKRKIQSQITLELLSLPEVCSSKVVSPSSSGRWRSLADLRILVLPPLIFALESFNLAELSRIQCKQSVNKHHRPRISQRSTTFTRHSHWRRPLVTMNPTGAGRAWGPQHIDVISNWAKFAGGLQGSEDCTWVPYDATPCRVIETALSCTVIIFLFVWRPS
jgi:hypothetical protein